MPAGSADGIDFAIRDRAAYVPAADAVIVADLHLGRGRTSNVELPIGASDDVLGRLDTLLETFEPAELVLAGDVLHAFSELPTPVEETIDGIRRRAGDAGCVLTLVEGNHDTMLRAIADPVVEHRLRDGETVVLHGHEPPSAAAGRYVIGHEHPAIAIEGRRRPCFLLGRDVYEGADVIALPAFTRLAAGTEVNGLGPGDPDAPLLADIGRFRPVLRDGTAAETLVFPPLRSFRELL